MRGGRFLPEVRKRETRTFVSSLPNRTFSRPVPELCGSTPDGDWHHATSVRFLPQGPRYRRERAFRRPRPLTYRRTCSEAKSTAPLAAPPPFGGTSAPEAIIAERLR